MRIVGGAHRGLRLAELGKGDPGAHLRPTSDRVRESLFSILASRGLPEAGAHVLDLFAGTGALGLEALSRGAGFATFVDNGRTANRLLRDNLQRAGRGDDARVLSCDARRLPAVDGEPAGLVFLDPPYARNLGAAALLSAVENRWLARGAIVVWEEAEAINPPMGFSTVDSRRFGDTHLTLLEYS